MLVEATEIADVTVFTPKRLGDSRGFFSEVYNRRVFAEAGVTLDFVQDNQSLSRDVGTLRGLHFQAPPFAQDKLVRVVAGSIFDVAVDIRQGSPTYGRWVGVELSAANFRQLLIPVGFAHGFVTLEPDTMVLYKVTAPYSGPHDLGIAWNDPEIGVHWPRQAASPILSAKDAAQPLLRDVKNPFRAKP
jgi:dTDP-4-dehydrorhamnose 3,5-epimerase